MVVDRVWPGSRGSQAVLPSSSRPDDLKNEEAVRGMHRASRGGFLIHSGESSGAKAPESETVPGGSGRLSNTVEDTMGAEIDFRRGS